MRNVIKSISFKGLILGVLAKFLLSLFVMIILWYQIFMLFGEGIAAGTIATPEEVEILVTEFFIENPWVLFSLNSFILLTTFVACLITSIFSKEGKILNPILLGIAITILSLIDLFTSLDIYQPIWSILMNNLLIIPLAYLAGRLSIKYFAQKREEEELPEEDNNEQIAA